MPSTLTLKKPDTEGAVEYFRTKNEYTTGPVEVSHLIKENQRDVNVVDVRAEEDYKKGHAPGAFNLPKIKWESCEGLSKDKINILYCYSQTCHLASKAAVLFASKGYPVMEMEGGYEAWEKHKLPTS